MKRIILSTALLLSCISSGFSQGNDAVTLSLQECVALAVEKNISIEKARIENEKSGYRTAEARSALLPQLSAEGRFMDNTKLAVTMLPGDIIGQPGAIVPFAMGVQYNTSLYASASQVLYNQTALTALKLSKQSEETSRLGIEKASESLAQEIAQLYFLAQTTAKQKSLIEKNIAHTKRMTGIVKTQVDNGIAKQVDYDRISVTLENQYTRLSNTDALQEQQLNMIKYMLEMPIQTNLILIDSAAMPLLGAQPAPMDDFSDHIDIRLLESQKNMASTNQKMIAAGYLPSLSLFGQYGYQGQRDNFSDYFNNSPANKWYSSSYIGVSLSIPIFDGFEKRSKSRQAKADYRATSLTLDNTGEKFDVDYRNAVNNYHNNKNNVDRQGKNIALADKVYEQTAMKYREGLATMSDLLQDEVGLINAQASYLDALYNLKTAELQIMSLNGEIMNLIKK